MNEEAGLLAAIEDAPKDRAVRLVYADWLDERSDSRGELVRVEEEMRRQPVHSDRFWQLKARRNELRSQAPDDWLEAMGYDGTACPPTFAHGVPDSWKERWRLIREFVERWHRIPLGDVGGRVTEVLHAEALLGRTLPPSLREWVAFAYDVNRDGEDFFVLRDVYQMRDLDDHPATSLLLQCEGDYHWAVRHEDFALVDPPVHGFHHDFESRFVPDERNPIAVSVTQFVLDYAMSYVHPEGGGFGTLVPDSARLIRDLEAAFPVRIRFGPADLFEAENVLAWLTPSVGASGVQLAVEVAKPSARNMVPPFLWEYTLKGGFFRTITSRESRP